MNLKVINVNETSRRTPTKLHQPTSTFHLNTRLRKGQVPPGFDNKVWNWNVPLSPQTRHIDFRLTIPALPQEDQHSGVLYEEESRIIPNINRRENSVCVCVCVCVLSELSYLGQFSSADTYLQACLFSPSWMILHRWDKHKEVIRLHVCGCLNTCGMWDKNWMRTSWPGDQTAENATATGRCTHK